MATDPNARQGSGEATTAKYRNIATNTDESRTPAPQQPSVPYTNDLAAFVVKSTFDTLPKHLVDHLRRLLLDNIGNSSYAAAYVESSPSYRAAVIKLNPEGGEFTVIGDSRTYSYLFAALLNGAHAHSMDADDTSIQMVGHPGAAVIAAGFAESERTDIQARAFFEALSVGYEIECRVGEALGVGAYSRGFHVTGVPASSALSPHSASCGAILRNKSPMPGGSHSARRPAPCSTSRTARGTSVYIQASPHTMP